MHRAMHTQTYDVEVAPGSEASFEYTFYPSNQLSPREFIFAFSVFYRTSSFYSNTFFNATVDVVEAKSFVDGQLLFLVLLAVVGVAVVGVWRPCCVMCNAAYATLILRNPDSHHHSP